MLGNSLSPEELSTFLTKVATTVSDLTDSITDSSFQKKANISSEFALDISALKEEVNERYPN